MIKFIGSFHPIIVKITVSCFTGVLITDILAKYYKKGAAEISLWFLIIGTVSGFGSAISGWYAAYQFPPTNTTVTIHMWLAIVTGVFAMINFPLRWFDWYDKYPLHLGNRGKIASSFFLLIMTAVTSDYGGLLTFGYTPFQTPFWTREAAVYSDAPLKSPVHEAATGEEAREMLQKHITVEDVTMIFNANQCYDCHTDVFEPDGFPSGIGEDISLPFDDEPIIYLPRNEDGTLKDYESSQLYQEVVLKNRMPIRDNGPDGLTEAERLVIMQWILNGAPLTRKAS